MNTNEEDTEWQSIVDRINRSYKEKFPDTPWVKDVGQENEYNNPRYVAHFTKNQTDLMPLNPFFPQQSFSCFFRCFSDYQRPSVCKSVEMVSHELGKRFWLIDGIKDRGQFIWFLFGAMGECQESLLIGAQHRHMFAISEDGKNELLQYPFFSENNYEIEGVHRIEFDEREWIKEKSINRRYGYIHGMRFSYYSRRKVFHGKYKPSWMDLHFESDRE